jgi:glycopeptide antibiotics resistance protein
MFLRHPFLSIATLAYLVFVGWVTLGPQPIDAQQVEWITRIINELSQHRMTQWFTYERVEFLANIAMFIPIGIFFVLLMGRKWWIPAIFAGVGLTLLIEFAQLFLPTRVPDVRDLIANSFGSFVGVILALIITTPAALRERRHERELAAARNSARSRAVSG